MVRNFTFSCIWHKLNTISSEEAASKTVCLVVVWLNNRVSKQLFFLKFKFFVEMVIQSINAEISELASLEKGFVFGSELPFPAFLAV